MDVFRMVRRVAGGSRSAQPGQEYQRIVRRRRL